MSRESDELTVQLEMVEFGLSFSHTKSFPLHLDEEWTDLILQQRIRFVDMTRSHNFVVRSEIGVLRCQKRERKQVSVSWECFSCKKTELARTNKNKRKNFRNLPRKSPQNKCH